MASAAVSRRVREEATCSICLELMTEPVTIDCGHNYCRGCITGLIDNQSSETSPLGTVLCPQCHEPLNRDSLRPNKQLENIIDTIKETNQERLCEEHGEKLHLFCEDDGQLLCWRCERSAQHRGHVTALVEEAYKVYKEKLQKILIEKKDEEAKCSQRMLDTTQQIGSWEEIIEQEKERVHSEFESLHTFLHLEEEMYMQRLEAEKKQKLSSLQDNVADLKNRKQELRTCNLELERKYQGSAQDLLQDIKGTLSRYSAISTEMPEAVSLEVDTVCDVSDFNISMIKRCKRYQVNVTLDPDTADSVFRLFNNQKVEFNWTSSHNISKSFNGVRVLPIVLGRERFTSGSHYFEVNVEDEINLTEWDVGVCLEDTKEPHSGSWAISLRLDKGYLARTSPPTPLHLREPPSVVGVRVDWDAGLVSFYSASTGAHIYTFSQGSFPRALRPYFGVRGFGSSLTLVSSIE